MENSWEDSEDLDILDYLSTNRINMARAFLDYKGGYSLRKLKKFYKQDLTQIEEDEEGKIQVVPRVSDEELLKQVDPEEIIKLEEDRI